MAKIQVVDSFLTRIEIAAAEASDAADIYHVKVARRDQLIVEAVEAGYEQQDIAAAAKISQPRIATILGSAETRRTSNQ